jgi:25S rRNA (cytosine2870-C5)-methyltransferase
MGRRAKNKQGDPAPLRDPTEERPSSKKLGKRKAAPEPDNSAKRPAKKAREAKSVTLEKSANEAKVPKSTSAKASKGAKLEKAVKKKAPVKEDIELEEDGGSSEGWEDVDDGADLKAQAR